MQTLPPTPLPPSRQSSRSPQPWDHIDMENLRLTASNGSEYSESDYGGSRSGGTLNAIGRGENLNSNKVAGSKEKGKIPDKIDLSICDGIKN